MDTLSPYDDLPPGLTARDLVHIFGSGEAWDEDDLTRQEVEDDLADEAKQEAHTQ